MILVTNIKDNITIKGTVINFEILLMDDPLRV